MSITSSSTMDIYTNLIKKFEAHFLNETQKNTFFTYMKNNCDPNFTNDIILLIEDYNSVLSQSIQAIKSLLSENARLLQSNTLEQSTNHIHNNNNNNNIHNYSQFNQEPKREEHLNVSPIEIKRPLREQIKKQTKTKKNTSYSTERESNEKPLKLSSLVNSPQYQSNICDNDDDINNNNNNNNNSKQEEEEEKLEVMKITNEILKHIELTQKQPQLFVSKYSISSDNLSNDYKLFLQNIIEYKYDLYTLEQILNDILLILKEESNPKTKFNTTKKTSQSPNTNKPFKEYLRNYNTTNNTTKCKPSQQKPFIQYTTPYSRLFN